MPDARASWHAMVQINALLTDSWQDPLRISCGLQMTYRRRIRPEFCASGYILTTIVGLGFLAAALALGRQEHGLSRTRSTVLAHASDLQWEITSELEAYDILLRRIQAKVASGSVQSCEAGRQCFQWLDRMTEQDGFKAVLVADGAGNLIYVSPNLAPGTRSAAGKEYFTTWRSFGGDSLYVGRSDPVAILDGATSMVISRALRTERGDFTGVVAAVVPLTSLGSPEGARLHLSSSLLTASGALIARFPSAESNIVSEDRMVVEEARAMPSGFFAVREPASGMVRVHGFYTLEGFSLALDVSASWRDWLAAWRR